MTLYHTWCLDKRPPPFAAELRGTSRPEETECGLPELGLPPLVGEGRNTTLSRSPFRISTASLEYLSKVSFGLVESRNPVPLDVPVCPVAPGPAPLRPVQCRLGRPV